MIRVTGTPLDRPHLIDRKRQGPLEFINIRASFNVSSGRNLGATESKNPWLLFLDDDCFLSDLHLSQLADRLSHENRPLWGMLYKRDLKGAVPTRAYNWIQRAWARVPSYLEEDGSRVVANVLGGALLIRADLFRALNGFDVTLAWGGEETELLRRAQNSGVAAHLLTDFEVVHQNCLRWRGFFRRAWMQGWNKGLRNLGSQIPWDWKCFEGTDLITALAIAQFLAIMMISSILGSVFYFFKFNQRDISQAAREGWAQRRRRRSAQAKVCIRNIPGNTLG